MLNELFFRLLRLGLLFLEHLPKHCVLFLETRALSLDRLVREISELGHIGTFGGNVFLSFMYHSVEESAKSLNRHFQLGKTSHALCLDFTANIFAVPMEFFRRSVHMRFESLVSMCQGVLDVADSIPFGGVLGSNAGENVVKLAELFIDPSGIRGQKLEFTIF